MEVRQALFLHRHDITLSRGEVWTTSVGNKECFADRARIRSAAQDGPRAKSQTDPSDLGPKIGGASRQGFPSPRLRRLERLMRVSVRPAYPAASSVGYWSWFHVMLLLSVVLVGWMAGASSQMSQQSWNRCIAKILLSITSGSFTARKPTKTIFPVSVRLGWIFRMLTPPSNKGWSVARTWISMLLSVGLPRDSFFFMHLTKAPVTHGTETGVGRGQQALLASAAINQTLQQNEKAYNSLSPAGQATLFSTLQRGASFRAHTE